MPRFRTTILQTGKSTLGFTIPPEVVDSLGSGKRPPVTVTINGYTYRNTVAVMDGTYMIGVSSEHRAAARVSGGEDVEVELNLDNAPREVSVPLDLAAALEANTSAGATFEKLSYSNKSWHVLQVTGAKTDETRQRRITRSIEALAAGRIR
jgi:uncharacterized protein YdeI (YjbR/CyaY-like superfamily)